MNEEDVIETFVMHLCIPDSEMQDGMPVPNQSSIIAMEALYNHSGHMSCIRIAVIASSSHVMFYINSKAKASSIEFLIRKKLKLSSNPLYVTCKGHAVNFDETFEEQNIKDGSLLKCFVLHRVF